MEKYTISTEEENTIITATEQLFKLRVLDAATTTLPGDTAVIEATLYVEQGGFIPKCSYFFELITVTGLLLPAQVNVADFQAAVDFFFHHVLGTELFVKSIPQASSLCPAERRHYQF